MNKSECTQIANAMKLGGYYSSIMERGPEYDRVKEFLAYLSGEKTPARIDRLQNPAYPCFPGLEHRAFHRKQDFPAVAILEKNFQVIKEEAASLNSDQFVEYTGVGGLLKLTLNVASKVIPRVPRINWSLYPFFYMGADVESIMGLCPNTSMIIRSLDDSCLEYPWGDAIFSVQQPGSGLPPHCSVDNFRVRCHLAIDIPEDNRIRVAKQTREWVTGECLLFEDSYVHEVWNRSERPRLVLITDFWHPDLTAVERQALIAGFRHSSVRRIFAERRINLTSDPDRYSDAIWKSMDKDDRKPPIAEYWGQAD